MSAEGWREALLGDHVSFNGGFGFSDRFQGQSCGELPFFKVSDMSAPGNERFLSHANNYVSQTMASRQGWKPAPPGGVAFAKVGAALLLNRRRVLHTESLVDNNMMVAVAGEQMDSTWLYWWLQTIDFGAFVQPGALPSVNQGQLQALPLLAPELPEQRRVAAILDTLDDAIRRTEQVIAKLQQMKQGLLHDLLTRGVDEYGDLRPPATEAPQLYKDSPLGAIPKRWEFSSVVQEFSIQAGVTLGPHRVPRQHPFPYLRVANVFHRRLELADIATLEARPTEVSSQLLAPGDILVMEGHANADEIGRAAITDERVAGFTFQNHLFRLRAHRLVPFFAEAWMNGRSVRAYWRRMCATSSGLNTINQSLLRAVEIAVPGDAEQQRIASIIRGQDARAELEDATLRKFVALKCGLLHDLLTGRVRVPMPEELVG